MTLVITLTVPSRYTNVLKIHSPVWYDDGDVILYKVYICKAHDQVLIVNYRELRSMFPILIIVCIKEFCSVKF